jgi:hypothetical protein
MTFTVLPHKRVYTVPAGVKNKSIPQKILVLTIARAG